MGHAGGQPGPHRQCWLGAVTRLNLRLLVHAQHQRALGQVQVKPGDIGQLEVELGVAAELESLPRWGCSPYFCPMRWTMAADSPTSPANRRALQ